MGIKRKNSGPHLSFLTNLNLTYEKLTEFFEVNSVLFMKKNSFCFYTTNIRLSLVKGSQHKLKKVKFFIFNRNSNREIRFSLRILIKYISKHSSFIKLSLKRTLSACREMC